MVSIEWVSVGGGEFLVVRAKNKSVFKAEGTKNSVYLNQCKKNPAFFCINFFFWIFL